ncbi:CatB-related O-acetyltransferase [Pelagicoccus sp. NFK12]|uniref:CatB-related O-acetyltransferase n=1 Tax=Pelagicoccus enzymogenes TaxID=2773457 RepID=A0A927IK09_9BACT|nr:CatB-related O-acetyltransferase [Pelagicoccus enzymogenes]MBD5782414.1 CatB-related O-acetyltransferase [Pelagicoccus enzymogenes]MDQ8200954.1 CatB-related O-acetyltransferase [Pelagicoccus enzymogenes]
MNPNALYPIDGFTNTLLLKPLIADSDVSNVSAGDYSYYSNFDDPTKFLTESVLYNFGLSQTSLNIGKFCAIAHGAKFIMADANHATSGISTFPFAVFGGEWAEHLPITEYPFKAYKDIEIGDDVWIGMNATILPGVTIGSGSIIGANAVVSSDIPPYSIAVGNPAKVVKRRYAEEEIDFLLRLAWWNWSDDVLESAIPTLVKGNVKEIATFAKKHDLYH